MATILNNEFTEKFGQQWAAFYNCMSKPMMDLAALNVKTFNNNMAKASTHVNEILHARKPEEVMNIQMKLANETSELGLKYLQDVVSIVTDASSDLSNISKRYASTATEAAQAAGFKSANKNEK